MPYDSSLLQPHGQVLSTLEQDGSRRWLHPKLARGRFWSRRRLVAYALIALFTGLPYLNVNGKPAILLDLLARRFTLFGFTFLPTDTVLLALLLVSFILTIFFVTALLGRAWCGWGCPQTVYMEFVFRPIERLCLGRAGAGGKPRGDIGGWRYALMYGAFLLVSLYLAHTFLAYFVGVQALRGWVAGSPVDHLAAFAVVVAVTGAMMFNFAFFREQTCTIACPYGRLQSVLLDRQSLIISYDDKRGEPRGKMKRPVAVSLPVANNAAGDCIDCEMCVSVCPTGIDIRHGLQLECIGCAQCIDACDEVMAKIGRPTGLIRYGSQAAMAGEKFKSIRPRVIVYPLLVFVLLGILALLLATRSAVDVTLLRGIGRPYVLTPAGEVDNTMRVKLTNRTDQRQRVHFSIADRPDVRAVPMTRDLIDLGPGETWTEPLQILAPPAAFSLGNLQVTLRMTCEGGARIDRPCRLLGPMGPLPPAAGPAFTTHDGDSHANH